MYIAKKNDELTSCTAHITKNRNRIKVYEHQLYLKDKQNFEIELFNPTKSKVLCKIEINGSFISDLGIVLKPGERVYLERFIDTNNKFIFETYDVEKSIDSLHAIKDNGTINVYFYNEFIKNNTIINFNGMYNNFNNNLWHNPNYYYHETPDFYGGSIDGITLTNYSSDINIEGSTSGINMERSVDSEETGRIERGESTSQIFEYTNDTFQSAYTNLVSYRILPESKRPIQASDIRNYCAECGIRIKKSSWKFCPSCGRSL